MRFKLAQPFGPFFATVPMVVVVNPRVVKAHEKNGDWAATWLASNEAGSGAYRLIPASYVPLEHAEMEQYAGHFIGWKDNPRPIAEIDWRPAQVTLDAGAGPTERLARHDRQQPAGRPGRAHPKGAQCSYRQEPDTMRLFLIRMNNTKPPFDNINARKEVLRPRLQLPRLHQRDRQGLRDPQYGAVAEQYLGLPEGRKRL